MSLLHLNDEQYLTVVLPRVNEGYIKDAGKLYLNILNWEFIVNPSHIIKSGQDPIFLLQVISRNITL